MILRAVLQECRASKEQRTRVKEGKGVIDRPPYFSLDGLNGSWIPYGGGFRACPGRHFAKREILMTLAVMGHRGRW